MRAHGDMGVGREHAIPGAVDLDPADVRVGVHHLALQVADVDDVVVGDADRADAGGGEVEQNRAAEPAGADDEDLRVGETTLAERADVREDDMPRVALRELGLEGRTGLHERGQRTGGHVSRMPRRPGLASGGGAATGSGG